MAIWPSPFGDAEVLGSHLRQHPQLNSAAGELVEDLTSQPLDSADEPLLTCLLSDASCYMNADSGAGVLRFRDGPEDIHTGFRQGRPDTASRIVADTQTEAACAPCSSPCTQQAPNNTVALCDSDCGDIPQCTFCSENIYGVAFRFSNGCGGRLHFGCSLHLTSMAEVTRQMRMNQRRERRVRQREHAMRWQETRPRKVSRTAQVTSATSKTPVGRKVFASGPILAERPLVHRLGRPDRPDVHSGSIESHPQWVFWG